MRRAITYISAIILAMELQAPVYAGVPITDEQIIIKSRTGRGSGAKTSVPKRSTSPVNIPVDTRRYRPGWSDANENLYTVECSYWQGYVQLRFPQYQGEARILVTVPGEQEQKLYRLGTSGDIKLPVGSQNGLYTIEINTSVDMEYSIEFEIVD